MTGRRAQDWKSLASELQQEIDGDSPIIAKQLFGDQWPDATNTTDQKAAEMVQEAYARGDRGFLTHLATQGPAQFLRVWKGLGGTVPPAPGTPESMGIPSMTGDAPNGAARLAQQMQNEGPQPGG